MLRRCQQCGRFLRTKHRGKGKAHQHPQKTYCTSECRKKAMGARAAAKKGTGKRHIEIRVNGRKVYEHIYVAEQMLGRKLLPDEIVHHKDENKKNNDPSNLEVLPNRAEHLKAHNYHRRKPTLDEIVSEVLSEPLGESEFDEFGF